MPSGRAGWQERLMSAARTGLGIVLALSPVVLWVAWSPFVLAVVAAAIAVSAGMFVLLHDGRHPGAEDPVAAPQSRAGDFDAEEFIEEIHRIFPLTYHHSLRGRARFRRAMDKLRRLAY
jgi:hypothetical protein